MDITGTQVIPAPRAAVWSALNDPAVLKECLPGCELVEHVAGRDGSDDEFRVVVAAAIGPLRARFNGRLRMTEVDAPQSCVMVFEGQGGAVGFGKGSATVALRETAEGTELGYAAKAQIGGKLAQVGSRLIDNVAKKMSDDFFVAFRKQLSPPQPAPSALVSPDATTPIDQPEPGIVAANPAVAWPSLGVPLSPPHSGVGSVVVPGWWLVVALVLGSAITIAAALLLR